MHLPPSDIIRSAPQLHSTKRLHANAPLSKGRLCFLLTLQHNTFWLTKVNKLYYNEQIINDLQTTNCNTQLQQKAAELTKSIYCSIDQAQPPAQTKCVNSDSTSWQRSSSVVLSGYHPVPLKLKGRGSFSLVRFFWRSKRNEQKLGIGAIAETLDGCLIALQIRTGIMARLTCRSYFAPRNGVRNKRLSTPTTHGKKLLFSFGFLLFTFE